MKNIKQQFGAFLAGVMAFSLLGFTVAEGLRIKPQAGLGQPATGRVLIAYDDTGMAEWNEEISVRNGFVKGGGSSSNAAVGGTLFITTVPISNTGEDATNLHKYTVPAHTLTNTGDRLTFRSTLVLTNVVEGSHVVSVIYGSETIATLTGGVSLGDPIIITGDIVRSGNTGQLCSATVTFGDYGGASTQKIRQSIRPLFQTNGIGTLFAIQVDVSAGYGNSVLTNIVTAIDYHPAPR